MIDRGDGPSSIPDDEKTLLVRGDRESEKLLLAAWNEDKGVIGPLIDTLACESLALEPRDS